MHEQDSEQKNEPHIPIRSRILKLLVVIVDEDRVERVTDYLRENFVRLQYACAGKGTANSDILNLFGLDGSEKALLFCLLPDFHADKLLEIMPHNLELHKHGSGIAFTMPLSGVCNPILHLFSEDKIHRLAELFGPIKQEVVSSLLHMPPAGASADAIRERMEHYMENESERMNAEVVRHDLVVAVVNQGVSEELMDAAKEAGANGGTVVNARRTGLDDGSTFLGMPVQAQKDIILILTDRKKKMSIMKAINHSFGMNTEARGIVFSLPVDSVAGLHATL